MLEKLKIDYLGVSIDALLIVASREVVSKICHVVESANVKIREIGFVKSGKSESVLVVDGKECDFAPRFRESAYTPLKKVVDARIGNFDKMKENVIRASEAAILKKERVLSRLRYNKKKKKK
jgi:hydrogenase expression/formation protein